ncbi:hypothetical protein CDAR_493051 [Caerostris darwini]|uniref:Cilia- and flagella-associated protein 418 n=1 Tax=Caerostris darwini TaxID=1538125 RepID=A0AAV4MXM5_9ARAC|nr:hypothetical protein CDAR_493051 [Caerostris darwini]
MCSNSHMFICSGNQPPSMKNNSCDSLRCTSCDFKASIFHVWKIEGVMFWDPSTNFLFLRNNMPDFDKLRIVCQRVQGVKEGLACEMGVRRSLANQHAPFESAIYISQEDTSENF